MKWVFSQKQVIYYISSCYFSDVHGNPSYNLLPVGTFQLMLYFQTHFEYSSNLAIYPNIVRTYANHVEHLHLQSSSMPSIISFPPTLKLRIIHHSPVIQINLNHLQRFIVQHHIIIHKLLNLLPKPPLLRSSFIPEHLDPRINLRFKFKQVISPHLSQRFLIIPVQIHQRIEPPALARCEEPVDGPLFVHLHMIFEVFILKYGDDVIFIRHKRGIRHLFPEVINGLPLVCKDEAFSVRGIAAEHGAYGIGDELLDGRLFLEYELAVFYLGFIFHSSSFISDGAFGVYMALLWRIWRIRVYSAFTDGTFLIKKSS